MRASAVNCELGINFTLEDLERLGKKGKLEGKVIRQIANNYKDEISLKIIIGKTRDPSCRECELFYDKFDKEGLEGLSDYLVVVSREGYRRLGRTGFCGSRQFGAVRVRINISEIKYK